MNIIGEMVLSTNKNEQRKSSFYPFVYILFFILFLNQTHSFSQNKAVINELTPNEINSLKLIRELEHFGRRELKLKLHHHFYTQWQVVEQQNTYLYISRADSIILPSGADAFQFFGTDTLAAKLAADSMINAGLRSERKRTDRSVCV